MNHAIYVEALSKYSGRVLDENLMAEIKRDLAAIDGAVIDVTYAADGSVKAEVKPSYAWPFTVMLRGAPT